MRNSVWRPVQRAVGFGQATPSPRSALGFIKKLLNDWSLDFGSLLAYVFVIALLPIAIAVFGIFALVFRANPGVRQNIIDGIVNSLQDNNTKTAVRQITNIAADNLESNAGGILAVGIVFSILGGSRLFVAIDNVFTIIYRTQTRSFIAQNLLSIGMLILFIILIIITFGASGAPSFLINTLPNQNGAQFGIFAAGIAISIFTSFILFILIYLIIPNRKMKLKHTWLGALIGAILLDIFIVLFPLYIRRFMGSFIGLIGAQINAYFSDRIQPLPEDLGTVLSQAVSRIIKITTTRPIFNTVQYPRSIRSRPYY